MATLFSSAEMASAEPHSRDRPGPTLDFRFADSEDAEDIAELVNSAFAIENVGGAAPDPAFAFRQGPRIVLEELRTELETATELRWIVLETPVPEERVVGAVAMVVGNRDRDRQQQSGAYSRPALLKCFSVVPDKKSN